MPLLFIDISGFTAMSTLLPVNDLSIVINSYFSAILRLVSRHGGDTLKFAGDAVFATFPAREQLGLPPHADDAAGNRLALAALCADAIVQELSDYKPPMFDVEARLNVHCGVAFDKCEAAVVSTCKPVSTCEPAEQASLEQASQASLEQAGRSELLVWGAVIDAVAEAEGGAALGEVRCCPRSRGELGLATSLLAKFGVPRPFELGPERAKAADRYEAQDFPREDLPPTFQGTLTAPATPLTHLSLRRRLLHFTTLRSQSTRFSMDQTARALAPARRLALHHALSPFAHSVVARREAASGGVVSRRKSAMLQQLQQDAELRPCYTVFAMVEGVDWGGDAVGQLQAVMDAGGCASAFAGTLRQFIVDDKGVVLIFNFGLPGFVAQNLVERVLGFALRFATDLHEGHRLKARIGIT